MRKYLKLQKIHGFFLRLIDFDEEYLFLVLQYLHHDDGGGHDCGRDGDVRGHDYVRVHVRDGVHVLKLLERKQNDQKALVSQYQTRHILIQPSEVVSLDRAKQMIDSLYNRAKAGNDFATLAATYSNDTGSARDGGSLGWVSPGVMVPEFEQVMKETPVGQISKPFQSQFGWHILQVTDTRQQDMTKEVQERMARQILGERLFDTEVDSWMRELRANAYVEIKDTSLDSKAQQK